MTGLTLVDTTLRDGTHAAALGPIALRRTVTALDVAGVSVIEVGHGYGLGGGDLPGASPLDDEQLEAALGARRGSRIAVLAVDGVASAADIARAAGRGADIVRVAAPADAPRAATGLVQAAKRAGATAVGFLTLAHSATPPPRLADRAAQLAAAGADVDQIADSAGALLPAQVAARAAAVASRTGIPVGVHAHDNLGLAVANTLAAHDAGATWLDGTLAGVGAGTGNAAFELVAAALQHGGTTTEVDAAALLTAADELAATWAGPLPRPDAGSVLSAQYGIYGTLLTTARTIAAQHGIALASLLSDARDARTVADLERAAQQLAGGAA